MTTASADPDDAPASDPTPEAASAAATGPGTSCPADGRALDPVAQNSVEDVVAVVAAARAASPAWAATSFPERARLVVAIARRILENREAAMAVLGDEMGRGGTDSLLTELATVFDYAKGAVGVARTATATERVKLNPINFPGKRVVVDAVPRGVVALITPWNYPLMQIYRPLFHALLAGNAVVIKPSEHTPRTAAWLVEQARAEVPAGLVGLLQGDGTIGAALVDAEIDALVFTGSVGTGRKVAARAGERLLPCSVELGGKDAAIVLSDCDLDRTVSGIAHWSMHNAGQDCSSIERVYVEEGIADEFAKRLAATVGKLRVAPEGGEEADMGPLQNADQLAIVARHVEAAIAAGAKALCGGAATGTGCGFQPTVLDHCSEDMEVVREETFGPVVALLRVPSGEEGVERANRSQYGLNGSVWTRDLLRGEVLARQLEVGVALVNNHSFTGVVPQTPWTGVKGTGTGVAASRHGYATFVRRRTVVVDRNKKPEVFWFPVNADLTSLGHAASEMALGALGKLFTLLPLLGKRDKAIRELAK